MTLIPCPIIRVIIDPTCPEETLLTHKGDKFFLARALIALHGNTSEAGLLDLYVAEQYGQKNESVLSAIASNSKCPPMARHILAKHESEVVRAGAALNPNLSQQSFKRLLNDKSKLVQEAAKRNVNAEELQRRTGQ